MSPHGRRRRHAERRPPRHGVSGQAASKKPAGQSGEPTSRRITARARSQGRREGHRLRRLEMGEIGGFRRQRHCDGTRQLEILAEVPRVLVVARTHMRCLLGRGPGLLRGGAAGGRGLVRRSGRTAAERTGDQKRQCRCKQHAERAQHRRKASRQVGPIAHIEAEIKPGTGEPSPDVVAGHTPFAVLVPHRRDGFHRRFLVLELGLEADDDVFAIRDARGGGGEIRALQCP